MTALDDDIKALREALRPEVTPGPYRSEPAPAADGPGTRILLAWSEEDIRRIVREEIALGKQGPR